MPEEKTEKAYITSITLGGFQVFDQPTTVPLGKLTFLFGPNSAGKSAIEDGLKIIVGALKNTGRYVDLINDDLRRHWRISNGKLAPVLTMGITARITHSYRTIVSTWLSREDELPENDSDCGSEVGLNIKLFYYDEFEKDAMDLQFELSIDGTPLLELSEGEYFGVNFSHPFLHGFVLSGKYRTIAAKLPSLMSYEDGWIRIHSRRCGFRNDEMELPIILDGLVGFFGRDAESNWQPLDEMLKTSVAEALDFFNAIKMTCVDLITITPDVVPASRKTPSPKQLTFLYNTEQSLVDQEIILNGDPQYKILAQSYLCKIIEPNSDPWFYDKFYPEIIDSVNSALTDHLFVERGYAISADLWAIVPFDESKYIPDRVEDSTTILVKIYLADSQGRKLSFEQVGSGLGYVLPVLCSVCNFEISISLIQQPELHLHPALQAAIGDFFIEHADETHQIIIETHSEHLLLRILKRIRQTSQGNILAPELQLHPNDVVVAYFDPKLDGTTTVKRLRISEDGEFLDRWPRGFFTERDAELFDE